MYCEQMIMKSFHDVMRISHAIEGVNYKRRATTKPWGSHLGILVLSIQVCWKATDPQLWLSWCLWWRRAYQEWNMWLASSICMYPDLSGELLVGVTLVCFDISQVDHYLYPLEPGIEWSTDHNPSVADCEGRINC